MSVFSPLPTSIRAIDHELQPRARPAPRARSRRACGRTRATSRRAPGPRRGPSPADWSPRRRASAESRCSTVFTCAPCAASVVAYSVSRYRADVRRDRLAARAARGSGCRCRPAAAAGPARCGRRSGAPGRRARSNAGSSAAAAAAARRCRSRGGGRRGGPLGGCASRDRRRLRRLAARERRAAGVDGAAGGRDHLLVGERLLEVVECAHLDRLDRRRRGAVAGDHDHRRQGVQLAQQAAASRARRGRAARRRERRRRAAARGRASSASSPEVVVTVA